MQLPDSIDDFVSFFDVESFGSDPAKKKLASSFFKQKDFNQLLVNSIHFLASELEKERSSNSRLIEALRANLRAQTKQIDTTKITLAQEKSERQKLIRELAFQRNLHTAFEKKVNEKTEALESAQEESIQNVLSSLSDSKKEREQAMEDLIAETSASRKTTEKELSKVVKEILKTNSSLDKLEVNFDQHTGSIEGINERISELTSSQDTLATKLDRQSDSTKRLNRSVSTIAKSNETFEDRLKKQSDSINALTQNYSNTTTDIRGLGENCDQLAGSIKALEKNLSVIEKSSKSFETNQGDKFAKLSTSIKKINGKLTANIAKVNELKTYAEKFEESQRINLDQIDLSLGKVTRKLNANDKKTGDHIKVLVEAKKRLNKLEQQISDLRDRLNKSIDKIEKAETEIAEASTELAVVNQNKLSEIESTYKLSEHRLDTLHKTLESSVLGFIALESAFKKETENTQQNLADISKKIKKAKESDTHLENLIQRKDKILQSSIEEVNSLFHALKSFVQGNLAEKEQANKDSQKQLLSSMTSLSEMLLKGSDGEPLLTAEEYLVFENHFRGSVNLILKRLEVYKKEILKHLKPNPKKNLKAADLGCGRGEWLTKLSEWGIANITGVDYNAKMVKECTDNGINAVHSDLFNYLKNAPENSHDLISAFHVLEHLSHQELNNLANELIRVLKPEGYFLFETPNPGNVIVGASSFWLDPTHKKPLSMELSQFFFEQRGFKIIKTYTLNGFDLDFNLGSSISRQSLKGFFDRWFGIGLDYSMLIQKSKN